MTRAEFKGAMLMLATNYNRELTRPQVMLWWTEFQHLLADEFRDAVTEIIRTKPVAYGYFPGLADLRAQLGVRMGPSLAEAGDVFAQVTDGRAPYYDPRRGDYWTDDAVYTRFGVVALGAFKAAGGRGAFQRATERDLPFLRRDFLAGWEEAATRPDVRASLTAQIDQRMLAAATPRGLAPLTDSLPRLLNAGEPDTP